MKSSIKIMICTVILLRQITLPLQLWMANSRCSAGNGNGDRRSFTSSSSNFGGGGGDSSCCSSSRSIISSSSDSSSATNGS